MNFICTRKELLNALKVVTPAIPSRTTLPILECVKLYAKDGSLCLVATNLELNIVYRTEITVTEETPICLPLKHLVKILNTIKEGKIEINGDKSVVITEVSDTLDMLGGTTQRKLNVTGQDANEFPVIENTLFLNHVSIPSVQLAEMVKLVEIAVATDTSRPVLQGVFVKAQNNELTMVTVDGYRLSRITTKIVASPLITMIVPIRALKLASTLKGDVIFYAVPPTATGIAGVAFESTNTIITAFQIEGRYPDYQQIVPMTHTTRIQVNTSDILADCKMSQVLRKDTRIWLKLDASFNTLDIKWKDEEGLFNAISLPVSIDGESLIIAFNGQYLVDVLKVMPTDITVIEFTKSNNPCVIKPNDDTDFIHVIMPMNVEDK